MTHPQDPKAPAAQSAPAPQPQPAVHAAPEPQRDAPAPLITDYASL